MNKTQRNVLVGFVAAISLTILFPPWQFVSLKSGSVDGLPRQAGYRVWFLPPHVPSVSVKQECESGRFPKGFVPSSGEYDFSDLAIMGPDASAEPPAFPPGFIPDRPSDTIRVRIPRVKEPLYFLPGAPLDTVKARSLEAYLKATQGTARQVDPVSGLEAKFIEARLDVGKLTVEWLAITLLSGALWLIFKEAPARVRLNP